MKIKVSQINYNKISGFNAFSLVLLLWGLPSQSRVFDMAKEKVAVYFGGSYGPSAVGQTNFIGTSGTGVMIEDSFLMNSAGDFGLVFKGSKGGLRLGVELIKPATLSKSSGSDANDLKLYDFESSISVLVTKIALELNIRSTNVWRTFFSIGGGIATASYKNSYTLNSDGQTAFPGVADFSEEGTSSGTLYDANIGYESLMNDTTTFVIMAGYRMYSVASYKYKADVVTLNGSHLKGEEVLNDDGTFKSTDFSGAMASVFFRFYLGK